MADGGFRGSESHVSDRLMATAAMCLEHENLRQHVHDVTKSERESGLPGGEIFFFLMLPAREEA
jgi:hypothetical protein